MKSLREILYGEFERVLLSDNFEDLFYLLKSGDYEIEIVLERYPSINNSEGFDSVSSPISIPIGYIYNNELYGTREKCKEIRIKSNVCFTVPVLEKARDIANISRALDSLYGVGVFKEIEKIIGDHWDAKPYSGCYVALRMFDIQVLGFDPFDHEDMDMGETDINEILSYLPQYGKIKFIAEQPWAKKLTARSMDLVEAGTFYLKYAYVEENKNDILDYSPLLLDFIKAAEVEFAAHIDDNLKEIRRISMAISARLKANENGNQRRHERELSDLVKELDREKPEIRGFRRLYLILRNVALGEIVDDNLKFKSYLSEEKYDYLKKERKNLERISHLSSRRNSNIHSEIIESENEFIFFYNELSYILELLAELKA